jgi:hypothetical protein
MVERIEDRSETYADSVQHQYCPGERRTQATRQGALFFRTACRTALVSERGYKESCIGRGISRIIHGKLSVRLPRSIQAESASLLESAPVG